MLRIGYFQNIHDVSKSRPYEELLDELREVAVTCDEGGFDCFWLPEHHFSVWGRELLPNPLLMACDLAARTQRMRIGLAAAIITFWHPLRLAEDVGLLDQLTGGRLELGVGRGNYGLEASNLNPAADPNLPEQNFRVFRDALGVLKAALANDRFSYKGEFYQYPAPGFRADRAHSVDDPDYVDADTGELVKLSVFPRPKQRPHPPMWQMVDSPLSVQFAAENDLGMIMWRPTVKAFRERVELYRRTAAETRGVELPLGARTGLLRDTFVADSEAEARRVAGDAVMGALNFSNWRGPRIYLDPGETLESEREAELKQQLTFDFVRDRSLLFGTPDQVVAKIEELREVTGIEQIVLKCSWPGLAHEHTMRSLRLIVDEVIPRLCGTDRVAPLARAARGAAS